MSKPGPNVFTVVLDSIIDNKFASCTYNGVKGGQNLASPSGVAKFIQNAPFTNGQLMGAVVTNSTEPLTTSFIPAAATATESTVNVSIPNPGYPSVSRGVVLIFGQMIQGKLVLYPTSDPQVQNPGG